MRPIRPDGYPPTAVGYPPTAVSYPPTAVSYPPPFLTTKKSCALKNDSTPWRPQPWPTHTQVEWTTVAAPHTLDHAQHATTRLAALILCLPNSQVDPRSRLQTHLECPVATYREDVTRAPAAGPCTGLATRHAASSRAAMAALGAQQRVMGPLVLNCSMAVAAMRNTNCKRTYPK